MKVPSLFRLLTEQESQITTLGQDINAGNVSAAEADVAQLKQMGDPTPFIMENPTELKKHIPAAWRGHMTLLSVAVWITLVTTPVLIGMAWWLRSHEGTPSDGWRSTVLLVSLLSASANALMYYAWLIYRFTSQGSPLAWRLKDILGSVGLCLVLVCFIAAILGKGVGRVPLGISAVLGALLWIPVAIL